MAAHPSPLVPDFKQARAFLHRLTGSEGATFQTFSDRDELKRTLIGKDGKKKQVDPYAQWGHGTLKADKDATLLVHLNAQGAGVFVMVNAGDGMGRTARNVTTVRAVFIDTDGAPFPADLPLMPHLVVESSPGRWHLYWLVNGLGLGDFATLQKALAKHYRTDLSVHDLPRVMRLPGFHHNKAESVMVQLLEAHDHSPYTPADIFTAWPFLTEQLEQERRAEAEKEQRRADLLKLAAERSATPPGDADRDRRRALAILAAHHDRVANAGSGTRHETLKESAYALGGYVGEGYLERDEVEDTLLTAAEACNLPQGEAADVIRWGLDKGAEKPLELTPNSPQMFGAKPSFGAMGSALNLLRPSRPNPCLVQSCSERKGLGAKPLLGGKPCL